MGHIVSIFVPVPDLSVHLALPLSPALREGGRRLLGVESECANEKVAPFHPLGPFPCLWREFFFFKTQSPGDPWPGCPGPTGVQRITLEVEAIMCQNPGLYLEFSSPWPGLEMIGSPMCLFLLTGGHGVSGDLHGRWLGLMGMSSRGTWCRQTDQGQLFRSGCPEALGDSHHAPLAMRSSFHCISGFHFQPHRFQ